MGYRAVIFDLGGVVLDSPLHAIARYERELGIPAGFVNRVVIEAGSGGAWPRLERGELPIEEFFGAFEAECREQGQSISAMEVMLRIGECGPRPVMLEALGRIRRRGIAVAALTNNWAGEQDRTHELREHFDAFVESSVVGLRKPDRRIYLLACESLAIEPAEAVFLDDIGRNLKTARELGMTTLKVDHPEEALDALSDLLGFPLR
jgi:epoxide hydrolase-like predicted phosphatase